MNVFSFTSIGKRGQKNATQTEWLAEHQMIHLFNVVGQRVNILIKFEEN